MNKTLQLVVLALIQKGDTYLFTLRNDPGSDYHGKWQIPGGCHEFAETPEETLHREVREELGIEVRIRHIIPSINTKVRGNWQGVFITYVCELKDVQAPIMINDEATDYRWMSAEELKHVPLLEGCAELIEFLHSSTYKAL